MTGPWAWWSVWLVVAAWQEEGVETDPPEVVTEEVQPPESTPRVIAPTLDALYLPPDGRAHRVTSAAKGDGNDDGTVLAPGADLTLAELEGPGVVTRLWFTVDSDDPYAGRNLVLRAWWDGEAQPSVEVPLGDFFGTGHGLERNLDSTPVRVSAEGRSRACTWPMPFNRSARISLRNDSDFAMRALHYHIDWRELSAEQDGLRTFHASYRQQQGGPGRGSFTLADVQGAGHYVGTVLSFASGESGWFGEGDDLFYVDGEGEPSLRGTGLDDYVGDAWTLREGGGAWSGVTLWEGAGMGCRASAYRWHVPDPIPFDESLRVVFETRGWAERPGGWAIVDDRPDQVSGVAFWYQQEPHAPFAALPVRGARRPFRESRMEMEEFVDDVVVPETAPAPRAVKGRFLAFGGALAFRPTTRASAELLIPFSVDTEGSYILAMRWVESPTSGRYAVTVDGVPLGVLDPRDGPPRIDERVLGARSLGVGAHVLGLRAMDDGPLALDLDSFLIRW